MTARTFARLIFASRILVRPVQAQTPDLRISVTGYLLGYYRVPDVQPTDFLEDCRLGGGSDGWGSASAPTSSLKATGKIGADKSPDSMLIGMGGNFGVELFSRSYRDPSDPRAVTSQGSKSGVPPLCYSCR